MSSSTHSVGTSRHDPQRVVEAVAAGPCGRAPGRCRTARSRRGWPARRADDVEQVGHAGPQRRRGRRARVAVELVPGRGRRPAARRCGHDRLVAGRCGAAAAGHSSGGGHLGHRSPTRPRPSRSRRPRAALTVRISVSATWPTARAWVMLRPVDRDGDVDVEHRRRAGRRTGTARWPRRRAGRSCPPAPRWRRRGRSRRTGSRRRCEMPGRDRQAPSACGLWVGSSPSQRRGHPSGADPTVAPRQEPAPRPDCSAMTDTPWLGDACSLVDAFRSGERSPVEELEAVLAAIEASDLERLRLPRRRRARGRRPTTPTCRCPSAACPSGSRSSSRSRAGRATEAVAGLRRPRGRPTRPR